MKAVFVVARRELQAWATRPFAWLVAALGLLLPAFNLALSTLHFNREVQRPERLLETTPNVSVELVEPYFAFLAVMLLFLVPIWTMGSLADERRQGLLPLLLSAPVDAWDLVLGKFLGLLAASSAFVLLGASLPGALFVFGSPEPVPFVSSVLGTLLLAAAMLSVGLAASSLTANPLMAAVLSFTLLLFLWILEVGGLVVSSPTLGALLTQLSLVPHAQGFWSGELRSADITHLLLFIAFFLLLARQRLDAARWSG